MDEGLSRILYPQTHPQTVTKLRFDYLPLKKPILERQVLVERKGCFIQGAGKPGEKADLCPIPTLKILLGHDSF